MSKKSMSGDKSGQDLSVLAVKSHRNGLTPKLGRSDSSASEKRSPDVKVSNIIGDFGPYQITVIIFAALRALSCAMDGLSGPFLSPAVKNFQCDICDISSHGGNSVDGNISNSTGICSIYFGDTVKTRYEIDSSQCFFDNVDSLRPDKIFCNKWSFNNKDNEKLMSSLTIEQSLVCDREWLKSLSNSLYFVGATLGLLFWGVISDRYGRRTAYICSHFVTLIFGFSALFAQSMCSFILLRSINAFGMIGELIPRSIQVEIVATEYRFVCSVICQIGWAAGIILVPALSSFNPSYRFILAVPVAITFMMSPWLIWLPESARWLMANQNFTKARNELIRAAKINGKLTDDIDAKIEQYNRQVLREECEGSSEHKKIGVWQSILAIFTNRRLLKDTFGVFVLLFVAEVVYFSLTLNVADLGGSLHVNYVISGLSELVSIAFCAVLLAYLSRRMCLSLLLLASTVSYLLMALVNVYEDSLSMTLILAVNAFGKLTAIGNLMVIILVSQEIFPTVIRQFGTSLCITVGKAGSAAAPFTHELGQVIGQSYCFEMFALTCLICAFVPPLISETGNRELPDTVIDVEKGTMRKRSIKRYVQSEKNSNEGGFLAHYKPNSAIAKFHSPNGVGGNDNHTSDAAQTLPDGANLTILNDPLKQGKLQLSVEDLNNNDIKNQNNLADPIFKSIDHGANGSHLPSNNRLLERNSPGRSNSSGSNDSINSNNVGDRNHEQGPRKP